MQDEIQPIDPDRPGVSDRNAARMSEMADTLTRVGLRLNAETARAPAAEGHSADHTTAAGNIHALTVSPQSDTLVVQTNLGNFRRQQGKLVVKAFVRPEAYAHALTQKGRGGEVAEPLPDDPHWLYKARWFNSVPHVFTHPSISRCVALFLREEHAPLGYDVAVHFKGGMVRVIAIGNWGK